MDLDDALWGAAAAAFALILGAALAGLRRPSPRVQSIIGHLASGVVTGVVAAELVPEILEGGRPLAMGIGFVAGAGLMISVERISDRVLATAKGGFLIATGLDVILDGLLIGFAFAIGTSFGGLLVLAFVLEFTALGLAVGSQSADDEEEGPARSSPLRQAIVLALPVIPAAAAGALVLTSAGESLRQGLLGFAVAVMLYLVTEELMKEAHEKEETPTATASFFVGFLILVLLELAILQ